MFRTPPHRLLGLALIALALSPAVAQLAVQLQGPQLRWQAQGRTLGSSDQWLQVRDLAAGEAFVPVPTTGATARFQGRAAELTFTGAWQPRDFAQELTLTVVADPPRDRAVIVRVALPLAAIGWRWWDDIGSPRDIEAGKHYDKLISWGGLRNVSRYPCCALTSPAAGRAQAPAPAPGAAALLPPPPGAAAPLPPPPGAAAALPPPSGGGQGGAAVGLSLAVPVHEPQVFRLAYDATRQALEAEFDLGLSPAAKKSPCRTTLRLLVYPHEAPWAMRSATERYYRLFPAYEQRRAGAGGIWLIGLNPGLMASPWDWGFRFEEHGLDHAGYNDAHDIATFVYTECWGIYEGFGNNPPPNGKDRYGRNVYLKQPEEMKQFITDKLQAPPEQKFWGLPRREVAQAEVNSAIEDRNGQWVWSHYTQTWSPGNFLSCLCLNPDPDLPKPSRNSVTWDGEILPAYDRAKAAGGSLGGVYLDSVCGYVGFFDENFRREQWQYADTPLVASYKAQAPVQLHAFSCFEISKQIADRMRAEGRLVIGNTGPPEMAYWIPLLDMIGGGEASACGISDDAHYRYLRFCGYHKPISWMQYGFVDPKRSWEEKERGMHRCLFYAVHPGTASFDAPAKYEPSRPLYRAYEQMIAWLDEAGWQPVTRASTDPATVLVERYGPGRGDLQNVTFLALRNPGTTAATASVTVDAAALPGGRAEGVMAWLLLGDRPADLARQGKAVTVSGVPVAPDRTEVVALGTREALARLWLGQAQLWLDRLAREAAWVMTTGSDVVANGSFEGGLAGWGLAAPPSNQRDAEGRLDEEHPIAGKRSALFVSHGDGSFHGLNQSVGIVPGEEYTLRLKYSWQRPEGSSGAVTPRFGVKGPDGNWAADKYIYFRDLQPTGDKVGAYEGKFTLPAGHSVGFFQFLFERNWGTVRLDDVEITSAKIEAGKVRAQEMTVAPRQAADALQARLAPAAKTDLLAVTLAQRAVYERLRDLAAGLPDSPQRRCLLLPVFNFAEALGRATETLTGVTMHPAGSPAFGDAGLGGVATINCTVTAGKTPLEGLTLSLDNASPGAGAPPLKPGQSVVLPVAAPMPAQAPWGWEDAYVTARFRLGRQAVTLTRRATLRLHPALQVEASDGAVSAVRPAVPLQVRSWLPLPAGAELQATATLAGQPIAFAPVPLRPTAGVPAALDLPLPAALAARLDDLARKREKLHLSCQVPQAGKGPQGEGDVSVVRGAMCPALPTAPQLDGQIGAAEWAGAARLEGFGAPDDGKPAARPTTVLLGHDATRLLVAVTCGGQPAPTARPRAHDGDVWADDCVELFLQPPGSSAYYHFGVNAVGSQMESRCSGSEEIGWNCAWEAQTGRTGEAWTVEVAIPIAALGGTPTGLWRMNFGREEADAKTATCWNPTGGGFHVPAGFGEVKL